MRFSSSENKVLNIAITKVNLLTILKLPRYILHIYTAHTHAHLMYHLSYTVVFLSILNPNN